MRAVTLDLLLRGDGAEDNLGKLTALERSKCDAPPGRMRRQLTAERHEYGRAHPTTSSGFLTMAIDRCVLSYTSRAM